MDLMTDGQSLPERIRLALFRIYQQTLVNVMRHAQAHHINVRFFFDERDITLEIEDDGRGFIVPEKWIDLARQGHMGLVGAAERAEAIGGKLNIESDPNRGTRVRVVAPRNFNGTKNLSGG
jgi:signal transduction histidine kinase